jgi:hypothetical protein
MAAVAAVCRYVLQSRANGGGQWVELDRVPRDIAFGPFYVRPPGFAPGGVVAGAPSAAAAAAATAAPVSASPGSAGAAEAHSLSASPMSLSFPSPSTSFAWLSAANSSIGGPG